MAEGKAKAGDVVAEGQAVPVLPGVPAGGLGDARELPLSTNDRPVRRIGLVILLLAFGVGGGWAAFAPLDSAAVAPGAVTVESYRKTVQHLEGGIVEAIRVRDGDRVEEGQTLILLDDTQARAQAEVLRTRYISALAEEARLIAERDGLESIPFPPELHAMGEEPRVAESMRSQERVFEARKATREGEMTVLNQRIEQLEARIDGLQALRRSKEALEASFLAEAADFRELFDQGLSDKQRMRQLERAAAEAAGEAGEHRASIANARLQIAETRQQILQLRKNFHAEVVERLREVSAQVFDLRDRLRAAEDTLERTVVRAPATGTVMSLRVNTIGGVIEPGSPLLDIVPEGAPLVVEARVSPTDIDKVRPGLPADIRFSAFSQRTTPVIEGEVLTVSADAVRDRESNATYYLARVQVSPAGLSRLDGLTLQPGMPAEVLIKAGSRTVLSYLLQPATDAMARAFKED